MLRVVMLGPPGSGKGTQATLLAKKFSLPAISAGDMLREERSSGTELGKQADDYMRRGALMPDEVMIAMIKKRLAHEDTKAGFLLDGFPRTGPQATALAAVVQMDHAVELRCDPERIIERLSGRRVHPASGRVYHLQHNPPAEQGKDDVTGEPLVQREDDQPEVIRKRLDVYEKAHAPVSDYYAAQASAGSLRYHLISADQDIAAVTDQIAAALA